jgi:hypothetical protein
MLFPVTIRNLLDYLQGRFHLVQRPHRLFLSDTIQLTQDIVEATELPNGVTITNANLSGAAGSFYELGAVPAGRKQRIMAAGRPGTTAATRLAVRLHEASVTVYISASQTGADYIYPPYLVLKAGDQIGVLTTGNGADNSVRIEYAFVETDLDE